ncbi:MAG: acylphosphatase, partial [Oscillospiraceae bacterium]|nr:acylphosphatase [Oscillospiraceae bacterium]
MKNNDCFNGGSAALERVLIHIHGIVQGVGFRPFIHKQVRAYRLAGT